VYGALIETCRKGYAVEHSAPNAYSDTWFELFLAHQDNDKTAHELKFLTTILPNREGARVLDVCCGYGRHAIPLAGRGYTVLGIDRDPEVIWRAQHHCAQPNATFKVHDMSRLDELPRDFDAVICMWQSFGYFDASTNRRVLAAMAERLRSRGSLVLDIYNRDFFLGRQGARTTTVQGIRITTQQRLDDTRLHVELGYLDRGTRDAFDWEVFTVDSIRELADHIGLSLLVACSGFDAGVPVHDGDPRMQLVFEKG
jgi:SAM-dependent methyltransferase